MNKNEMIEKIIRKYGFENKKTINFCIACEKGNTEKIEKLFGKYMEVK